MPLPIQLGELANRIRRAFDVRGRMPLALDETVVPVLIVGDATDFPFSLDPLGFAGHGFVVGQAANRACVAVSNQGPEGSIAVIEQLVVSTSTGAASQDIEISRSGILQTAVAALETRRCADVTSDCRGGTGLVAREVPVLISEWDLDITTGGTICERLRTAAFTSVVLAVRHVLRRGEVMYVKPDDDATDIMVGISGRFYNRLSDTGA